MVFKSVRYVGQDVVQREFDTRVANETVPCALWTPARCQPRALIAMGHGGSEHKKSEGIVTRAIRYADGFAWATLAIDAPEHGERISPEEAALERAKTLARVVGTPGAPALSAEDKIKYLDDLAARAVPEWQAALDAVLDTDFMENGTPTAYWGVSQSSSIGIPLLAVDKRFKCAVLGLAQLHPEHTKLKRAAEQVTVPLRFAFQRDDPIRDRDCGLALFNAFGSQDKSMHVNPGGHTEIPASEVASWDSFFERHLLGDDRWIKALETFRFRVT